jgi:group I intron endonuclease
MPDYSLGKVYKLYSITEPDKMYIGSTAQTFLSQRMLNHKKAMKKVNSKIYQAMREIGYNNFKIELVESYSCKSKDELRQREQYWINTLKPFYNVHKAYQTEEELKETKKQYRQTDKGKQCQKQYKYTDNYKQYQKKYKQTDKYKQYAKEYQQTEKRKQSQKQLHNQIVFCIYCKKQMKRSSWYRHIKQQRHNLKYNIFIENYEKEFGTK